jgi:hypothetical protein
VLILDPIRRDSILQGLVDAVERPGARRNAIVNRDAHIGATQEQLPVPLPDGWESGGLPIDYAGLRHDPKLPRGGVERCVNPRLVAMDDDDIAAVMGDQSPQNSRCKIEA